MKKTLSLITIFICLLSSQAQDTNNKYISGVVTDANNKKPVVGLIIYTEFYETKTDDLGRYNFSLLECNCKIGDKIVLRSINDNYGYSERSFTIPNDLKPTFDFGVFPVPNNIFINGLVRDEISKEPIKNIEVKIILDDYKKNINTVTQSDGTFQIPIPKEFVSNSKTVHVVFTDKDKMYHQENGIEKIKSFLKKDLRRTDSFKEKPKKINPKEKLNSLGVDWNLKRCADSFFYGELEIAELFIKGGMPLNSVVDGTSLIIYSIKPDSSNPLGILKLLHSYKFDFDELVVDNNMMKESSYQKGLGSMIPAFLPDRAWELGYKNFQKKYKGTLLLWLVQMSSYHGLDITKEEVLRYLVYSSSNHNMTKEFYNYYEDNWGDVPSFIKTKMIIIDEMNNR